MFGALFSAGETVALAVLPLIYMLFWTAVRSSDPAKREAAMRLLAMLWRHKDTSIVQTPPTRAATVARRKRRRGRNPGS